MKRKIALLICIASSLTILGCTKEKIATKDTNNKTVLTQEDQVKSNAKAEVLDINKAVDKQNPHTKDTKNNEQTVPNSTTTGNTNKKDTPITNSSTEKSTNKTSNNTSSPVNNQKPKTNPSSSNKIVASQKAIVHLWPEKVTGEISQNNYSNRNLIEIQGEWLYYFDIWTKDLIKIKTDGTSKKILKHGNIMGIALKNNYIYYNLENRDLRKIKIDGTDDQAVATHASHFSIVGESIYHAGDFGIKVKNSSRLDFFSGYGRERDMVVLDNKIYYVNMESGDSIYRMNLDGSRITYIGGAKAGSINKYNNRIYYLNGDDNNRIYSSEDVDDSQTKAGQTNWSGKEIYQIENIYYKRPSRITMDSALWPVVSKGWIYYSNSSDNNKLYRIMTDGTGRTKLNNEFSANIKILGDWVFYTSKDSNKGCYLIKKDGSRKYKL